MTHLILRFNQSVVNGSRLAHSIRLGLLPLTLALRGSISTSM